MFPFLISLYGEGSGPTTANFIARLVLVPENVIATMIGKTTQVPEGPQFMPMADRGVNLFPSSGEGIETDRFWREILKIIAP